MTLPSSWKPRTVPTERSGTLLLLNLHLTRVPRCKLRASPTPVEASDSLSSGVALRCRAVCLRPPSRTSNIKDFAAFPLVSTPVGNSDAPKNIDCFNAPGGKEHLEHCPGLRLM
eukprot:CAMPEP_0197709878 /NCGR_PEP_ID=MMETSP1338-20131121/128675_1 /TAXON_ID=43686 ORGANISM="Pelagodinium beii, Strain RCC1491" /NCGR_SAMPLE_ID=MMETSP1338 /ASSEMBLY_ACC=CAM_ASM_000754 /LENGTH=113 /DNA_ID=CAMNT_0043293811 /DNA_START=458 /DNA_END=799 /DNA_ORIENTATION=-